MAQTGLGRYFHASDSEGLAQVYAEIDTLEKSKFEETKYSEYTELFRWFAAPGLAMLLIVGVLTETRFARCRRSGDRFEMEWQYPGWLYLILPLAAAWLLLSLDSRSRRRRAAEAFVARAMQSRILPWDSRARFWVKLLFRESALVTGLVALAGPRF